MKTQLVTVINEIYNLIHSEEFKERNRVSEKCFVRKRKLVFSDIVSIILCGLKCGLQHGIDIYLEKMTSKVKSYSSVAFCNARKKISPQAFRELFHHLAEAFYRPGNDFKTFKGFRVCAIDGTDINLPTTEETLDTFGSERYSTGPVAQSLCSCLYDVMNNVVIDAVIDRFDSNERELAVSHIEYLKASDNTIDTILLFDRGYPSLELMQKLDESGNKYLMRVNKNNFLREVRLAKGQDSVATRTKNGKTVVFRIISIEKSESIWTYITNILDDSFSPEDFNELYRMRWAIETNYDELKNRFELENFSGKSSLCIMQDIYASLFLANMIAFVERECAQDIARYNSSKERLYEYKLNRANTIRQLRNSIIDIIAGSPMKQARRLNKLRKQVVKSVVPIRPNRHFPRGTKSSAIKFHSNRKP